MPLGPVLFLGLFLVFLLFVFGANACYAILVDEVQRRLPENQQIRFPFGSWNVFEIARLHQQLYPVRSCQVFVSIDNWPRDCLFCVPCPRYGSVRVFKSPAAVTTWATNLFSKEP